MAHHPRRKADLQEELQNVDTNLRELEKLLLTVDFSNTEGLQTATFSILLQTRGLHAVVSRLVERMEDWKD